jgi:ribonuclease HI
LTQTKQRAECEKQVKGFPKAQYKSFTTRQEAECWLQEFRSVSNPSPEQNSQEPKIIGDSLPNQHNYTIVWTDGSALGNSRSNQNSVAGSGVYFDENHPYNRSVRLPGIVQTNQRAEIYVSLLLLNSTLCELIDLISLKAAIIALETAGFDTPLAIHTDSQYLIKCKRVI